MTRFALAGSGGSFGAMGLDSMAEARAMLWARSEFSAIAPRPTPHSLKNHRRVIPSRYFSNISSCFVIVSLLGDRLVQIQQHARKHGVASQLARRNSLWLASYRVRLPGGDFDGVQPILLNSCILLFQ